MISGYLDESSLFPGVNAIVRVSTDAPWFRIDAYRQGPLLQFISSSEWIVGAFAPDHRNEDDWSEVGVAQDGSIAAAWPAFPYAIPVDWISGVYIFMFVEGDSDQNPRPPLPDTSTADARAGKALLIVRNPEPGFVSQLLYKVPLFTYHAYNQEGGNSIYQGHNVHFHRPGGGTGGTPWDAAGFPDAFDSTSPRQTFAHWDARFVSWLESKGYRIDYCTDLDIHRDGLEILSPYAVLLCVGHDEYYSEPMRDAMEAFRDSGGNIAFLSGNTCWWRVEFDQTDNLRMLGQQTIQNWSSPSVSRPEDSLTGTSYRNAGWGQDRPRVGFTVQHTEQWPFEGTGLAQGDVIGADDALVGYECDGAPCNSHAAQPIEVSFQNPDDGTPGNFVILGVADTSGFNDPLGNHTATMGMYVQSGTVFTGATTDWPRVAAQDDHVGRITLNVLDRLGGNPKGLATLASMSDVIACDSFFSSDDNYRHAIVGMIDGSITEIFFNPQDGQGRTIVSTIPGMLDLAGFWSDDDQRRHIIAADNTGAVWEVFFHPSTAPIQTKLADIDGASRVAAFYSHDNQDRHAIVATAAGDVSEIYYHPARGIFVTALGSFPSLVDIGGFYSDDDRRRHVVVAQGDGTITEIYYHPSVGISQALLGVVPGARRVSGYYANDAFFNRRVVVVTDDALVEFRYHPHFGVQRAQLIHTACTDAGACYSPDDGFRHVILASLDGAIEELFFRP
ncbi:MAG TPA: N,N-dimethylformamidase beta subunit family domain-containing protein [Gemmatimonadaceae bacterium]